MLEVVVVTVAIGSAIRTRHPMKCEAIAKSDYSVPNNYESFSFLFLGVHVHVHFPGGVLTCSSALVADAKAIRKV